MSIKKLCIKKGLRMTPQRRVIAEVLSRSHDHPDVETLYRRATKVDRNISIATVYRTVRLFEDAAILERHEFSKAGEGKSRFEEKTEEHHDHLVDLKSGRVVEFVNDEIEKLQKDIAKKLGYKLVDHRLELYAIPLKKKD
jgi:Fur family ferric uptake transcriptional regulator|tara:strand:- start:911 stop:1330 length:420 start_codon:yes stop_codon:yes gene_type:complete